MNNFYSDKAVKTEDQDFFQRYPFSKRIAETIIHNKNTDCLVYGLYGEWGSGKSSMLNFIEGELEKEEDIIDIKYNPWRYKSEEELLLHFFGEICETLEVELFTKIEKFGKWFEKLGSVGEAAGVNLSSIGTLLSSIDLRALKERVEKKLEESGKRLVIFIDDIDRLDKQEMYAILRLVKLTGDFSNTTYILSFDKNIVAAALGVRYGGGDLKAGFSFLEKIVQVPLEIPHIQRAYLFDFCHQKINAIFKENDIQLPPKDKQKFDNNFKKSILPVIKNPRLIIRYLNAIGFSLPMMKGEVNYVDLLLIEAIKVFYPKYYALFRDSSLELTNFTQRDSFNEQLREIRKTTTHDTQIWILAKVLFPYLNENNKETINRTTLGRDKSIGTIAYFQRYFSYSIQKNDLSDIVFESYLDKLRKQEGAAMKFFTEEFIEIMSLKNFIEKLKLYTSDLEFNSLQLLLDFIYQGEILTEYQSKRNISSDDFTSLFRYTVAVLEGEDDTFKKEFLREKLLSIKDFIVAYDFYIFLKGEEELFTEEEITLLSVSVIEKGINSKSQSEIFIYYAPQLSNLFPLWVNHNEQLAYDYLLKALKNDENLIFNLLSIYGYSQNILTKNLKVEQDFSKEHYEFFKTTFKPVFIYEYLIQNHTDELKKEDVFFLEELPNGEQNKVNIARQFIYFYDKEPKIKKVL